MKQIRDEELKKMSGGFSIWAGIGIAAVVVFLVGVVDGIIHPKSCEITE